MSLHCYRISVYDSWEKDALVRTLYARHRREVALKLGCSQHVAQALSHGKNTRHYDHVVVEKCDRNQLRAPASVQAE